MQNDLKEQTEKAFNFDAFGKFRSADEIAEKAKATGTGLLTGTAAIPSDVITMAETANTFLADYANNPLAMLIKDNLQSFEKQYGRKAFDEGFEEITGIKSDPENTDQLIGEILSPTGAFLAPTKFIDKLSDGASTLYNTIKNTLSNSDFVDSNLVTEGAKLSNITSIKPIADDINKAKIDLNVVGEQTEIGKQRAQTYREAEYNILKEGGTAKRGQEPKKSTILTKNIKETDSLRNYEMLTLPQKQKLFSETGVYRGRDGKLRYKLDTRGVTLKTENFTVTDPDLETLEVKENATLGDIINFEDLFKQYYKSATQHAVRKDDLKNPIVYGRLRDIKIEKVPAEDTTTAASYDPIRDVISISSDRTQSQLTTDILHEIQHAVQEREGFVPGSSVENFLPKDYGDRASLLERTIKNSQDNLFTRLGNKQGMDADVYIKNNLLDSFFGNVKLDRTDLTSNEAKAFSTELAAQFTDEQKMKMFKNSFEDTITKLAKREADRVDETLTNNKGVMYTVNPLDRYEDATNKGRKIMFSASESQLINSLSSKQEFKSHVLERILSVKKAKKLDEEYLQARRQYQGVYGEMESRMVEDMYLNPDAAISPEMLMGYEGQSIPYSNIDSIVAKQGKQ